MVTKNRSVSTHIILILFFVFPGISSLGQLNRSEVISAYVYNFAKQSSSEKQANLQTYNLVLVSEKQELISGFEEMAKRHAVKKKNISLSIIDNAIFDFSNTCLVFVGSDKIKFYDSLFIKTKNQEVLIVSENYTDKRKIMLNLYDTKDGKIQFTMNRGNIYERQITISDEILLMGGSEIDLVKMYLESQNKLDTLRTKLNLDREKLIDLTEQINKTQEELNLQKEFIAKEEQSKQELVDEIKRYKTQLYNQKRNFEVSKKEMDSFYDSLNATSQMMRVQKHEINIGNEILKKQQEQIKIKTKEIEYKEEILSQQLKTIGRQRNTVAVFVLIFVVIVVLLILLIKNIRAKNTKNKQLEKQKLEIGEKNDELKNINNVVQAINNKLNEKNEELKTSLEEIKNMQKQLVQSEKMASLGVLSAGIAHEINNPINFVYAGINSLLRDFEDIKPVIDEVSTLNSKTDNLQEKIEEIKKLKEELYFDEAFEAIPAIINDIKLGADRTAEIVKGLKSFSRVEKGELQSLNIHEGIDTALLLLKNKYKDHVEITKNYEEDIPLIKCFPGKINQALLNIISNAVDSIDEKGEIIITTEKTNKNIHISIKDTGCGMPKNVLEKLFDPFFTTKPIGKGTGLGLSITYGIIQEHNGSINVKSVPDKGSEFIIKLPIT
jgi:signal transduction histidine kinase